MKNYIEEIVTVTEFIRDNPHLAEQATKAKRNLLCYYPNDEENFIIITVEGYKCVACLTDDFSPYEVAGTIAPFDENRIYPIQGLETVFQFKSF